MLFGLLIDCQHSSDYVSGNMLVSEPICSQCILSLPTDHMRKPYGFLVFSVGRETVHWE